MAVRRHAAAPDFAARDRGRSRRACNATRAHGQESRMGPCPHAEGPGRLRPGRTVRNRPARSPSHHRRGRRIQPPHGQHGLALLREIAARKPGQPSTSSTLQRRLAGVRGPRQPPSPPSTPRSTAASPIHGGWMKTRPRNQGARSPRGSWATTASAHVIPDNAGGHLMQHGLWTSCSSVPTDHPEPRATSPIRSAPISRLSPRATTACRSMPFFRPPHRLEHRRRCARLYHRGTRLRGSALHDRLGRQPRTARSTVRICPEKPPPQLRLRRDPRPPRHGHPHRTRPRPPSREGIRALYADLHPIGTRATSSFRSRTSGGGPPPAHPRLHELMRIRTISTNGNDRRPARRHRLRQRQRAHRGHQPLRRHRQRYRPEIPHRSRAFSAKSVSFDAARTASSGRGPFPASSNP